LPSSCGRRQPDLLLARSPGEVPLPPLRGDPRGGLHRASRRPVASGRSWRCDRGYGPPTGPRRHELTMTSSLSVFIGEKCFGRSHRSAQPNDSVQQQGGRGKMPRRAVIPATVYCNGWFGLELLNVPWYCRPRSFGEHAEQNVSLATSPAAGLRWTVGSGRYGAPKSVPSFRVRHHGSTPPRDRYDPLCLMGDRGLVAPIAESRPGFSEQYRKRGRAHLPANLTRSGQLKGIGFLRGRHLWEWTVEPSPFRLGWSLRVWSQPS
jgi:hypothetical protein